MALGLLTGLVLSPKSQLTDSPFLMVEGRSIELIVGATLLTVTLTDRVVITPLLSMTFNLTGSMPLSAN